MGQPATEQIDLDMYARIRDEGFNHSHVMEYASALFDDIGPRLTGSPAMGRANEWTLQQLKAMGCSNAHLESWGEFGMAWTQRGASLTMVKPSAAVFLSQATPWSPATNGALVAEVIKVPGLKKESDFAEWKGKLRGKVILYGHSGSGNPEVNPDKVPAMEHYDAAKLREIAAYPLNGDMSEQDVLPVSDPKFQAAIKNFSFQEKVGAFFAAEGAAAVLEPGGSGGVLHDDTNASLGWFVYRPEHRQTVPEEVIADEAYDRMERLLEHNVPVTVSLNVSTEFGDEHAQGYNTVAEIPGTDAKLKDEVVLVGGHLDSWIAGTGATDNGAGSIVAMEAMRILNALHVQPRRTIRVALWSGEEEGLYGSQGYVKQHFGTFAPPNPPDPPGTPSYLGHKGALTTTKEWEKLDAYYNLDNGTGKVRGIYCQGNYAVGPIFKQWIAPLADLGVSTVTYRNTGGTDHLSYDAVGLPGFQFIQDPMDYETRTHHSDMDTVDRLHEFDLEQGAVLEAIFLYNTA
ncbi:MAG: M20/M25/M40 family metallo-hydrolase, partial [Terriglobus roseus]|nr:M20/M25/M40 family metallo-hydrolase [Terriglobus roseus]